MLITFASSSSQTLSIFCIFFVKAISLWILIQTSTSNVLLQDQYIGCFKDNSLTTDVSKSVSNENALTIEECIAKCKASHTTYAALQNGNDCQCREDYGLQLPESTCNIPCTGNMSEFCGGFAGQQVTYVLYTVCPIGSYDTQCEKGCHCKREIPCDRMTGNCPDGCYGNWSGSACNLTSASQKYIGCYKDYANGRAMEKCIYCDNTSASNKNNTLESCFKSCSENSYSYAGLEYSWQCFCGDNYTKNGNLNESTCSTPCSGDNKQICGGTNAISVYSVCPTGNYGRSCAERCHCSKDESCFYRNGSCPSRHCAIGWTGSSCNKRDCSMNKGDCYPNETCSSIKLKYSSVSVCRCSDGFERSKLWENCTDIDECKILLCDTATTTCNNTVGSYSCSCKSGFQTYNATTCIDIDECQRNLCDNLTTKCQNSPGSYKCSCKKGFDKFNGQNCTDIDECSQPSKCGPDAINCTNTFGSYNCTCSYGECTPKDEQQKAGGTAGAVVGSLLVVVVVVAIALALLFFWRRRNGFCKSSQNESNKPTSEANDLTLNSSQENVMIKTEKQESYYGNCSSVTVKELSSIIRHKLSTQGVLDKEFKVVPMETKDPSTVGKNRDLKKKNRFRNIVPYDKNRVVLSQVRDVAFSDYINASLIRGYKDTDKLIATQGPLPETIGDFWRMVCEKDVNVIVMITDLMENGKAKCAKYWPDIGKPMTCTGITVRTTSEHLWNGYASRHFKVTKDSKTLEVTQWHFLSYPDHGVPEDVAIFMSFLKKVRSSKLPGKSTVVHCSAGAGRTGTFIAIDYIIQQGSAEGQVDILGCLKNLRKQRTQMIQNLAQYQFVHSALLFEYTVGDTTIPCDKFAAKFAELQKKDNNTGMSKLETQFQSMADKKENTLKESKTNVSSKSIDKHRIAEMNVTFLKGWKQKDAYIALTLPRSTAVDDFYSLTKEFNCGAVIYLDGKLGTEDFLFPTKEKPIVLRSSTVTCDSSSKEDYGTCYKISQVKVSDDTYANVSVYANAAAMSVRTDMRVLHVTNLANSEFLDCSVLNSIYNCMKKLNAAKTAKPAVIISRAGNSVSAFCLAALIAFDMIREDKEVDIFQIVQCIQKSRPQFSFSLPLYKELHSVVGKYMELASSLPAETISHEPLYEETR